MKNLLMLAAVLGFFAGYAAPISGPTITVIPTIGPNLNSPNFSAWTTNTILGLRGIVTPPFGTGAQAYVPLSGTFVDAGQLIASESLAFSSWQGVAPGPFGSEQGNSVYFSFVIRDPNPAHNSFSLSQLTVDETYLGVAYGSSGGFGNYRSTLVGVQADGTVLSSNEADTTLVNALYYVGVGFSWQAQAGTGSNQDVLNQNIAAIQALTLADRTSTVCYSIGSSAPGCATVTARAAAEVPEPGSMALFAVGGAMLGLGLLRRRR